MSIRVLLLGFLTLLPATAGAEQEARAALRAGAVKFLAIHYLDTVPRGATCVSINGATPTDAELTMLRKVRPIDPPADCACQSKDDGGNCLRAPSNLSECRVEIDRFTLQSATRATVHVSYSCGSLSGAGEFAQFWRVDGEWIHEASPHRYVN